jgi:hypothetical protein
MICKLSVAETTEYHRNPPNTAIKRPLGVWEVPEGLDQMTDEEIDDLAGEIGDAMAVAIERLEQSPPKD